MMWECNKCKKVNINTSNKCNFCGFKKDLGEIIQQDTIINNNEITKKYGIIFENDKYILGQNKYKKIEDALNYAKLVESKKEDIIEDNSIGKKNNSKKSSKRIIRSIIAVLVGLILWFPISFLLILLAEIILGSNAYAPLIVALRAIITGYIVVIIILKIGKKKVLEKKKEKVKIPSKGKNQQKEFYDDNGNIVDIDKEKICPDCGEVIKYIARKCRFCGYKFDVLRDS